MTSSPNNEPLRSPPATSDDLALAKVLPPPVSPKLQPAAKGTLAALLGTTAAAFLMTNTPQFEGWVLKGYKDPIGIPTKCAGDTYDVVLNKAYTDAECRESLNRQLVKHAKPVVECAPWIKGRFGPTVALVDLSYNAGAAGACRSTAAKLFKQADWVGGCKAIRPWNTATFKTRQPRYECRQKKDGKWSCVLPGLKKRRDFYANVCVKDVLTYGGK